MLRDLLSASSLFLIGGLFVSGCGSSDSSGLTASGGSSNTAGAAGSAGASGSGGSAGSGLGGSGGQGAGAGSGAGGAGAGSSGGAGAGGAGGAGGVGAGGSGGSGAGGVGAAGAGGSGGSGGAVSGGAGGTAGSTWSGPGMIGCGSDTCGLNQSEFCCLAQGAAPACVTKSNECKCTGILCQALELRCDGSEDCPGKICCLEKAIAQTPKITCEATCESAITVDRKEVCKVGHPSTCTKGGTCKQAPELPPGVGSCQ